MTDRERAGADLDALFDAIETTLAAERPAAEEIRSHVEVLRALSARLEETAAKLDDLATIRDFSEKVGLRS